MTNYGCFDERLDGFNNADSFTNNGDEVNSIYESYCGTNTKPDCRVAYKQGYQCGYTNGVKFGFTKGKQVGYKSGFTNGYKQGYTCGVTNGTQKGYKIGYEAGYTKGLELADKNAFINGMNCGIRKGYEKGYVDGYESCKHNTHSNMSGNESCNPNEYYENPEAFNTESYNFEYYENLNGQSTCKDSNVNKACNTECEKEGYSGSDGYTQDPRYNRYYYEGADEKEGHGKYDTTNNRSIIHDIEKCYNKQNNCRG
ncbi:MAG: hypothetical protein ACRC2K_09865 [Clostridium sp.]